MGMRSPAHNIKILLGHGRRLVWDAQGAPWLRTDGVNTNGAAAKVTHFDRLGKKVRPGTFGKKQIG